MGNEHSTQHNGRPATTTTTAEQGQGQIVPPSVMTTPADPIRDMKANLLSTTVLPQGGGDGLNSTEDDADLKARLMKNVSGGQSFKLCDINRLKRFIVLGSETNTYYSTKEAALLENVLCVKNLLQAKRHEEVLQIATEYSLSGRVPKDEPILTILAMCAVHPDIAVRKAAFSRVNEICNIPTKLFRFLQLTQGDIDAKRKSNPPEPQLIRSTKRSRGKMTADMKKMNIGEDDDLIVEDEKEPSENVDVTLEPKSKKVKPEKKQKKDPSPGYKKVNKEPSKSSGWGRMRRKSIAAFYADEKKDAARLLLLVSKYKSRHDWNHKQVLTYAHPKLAPEEKAKHLVLKYATLDNDKVRAFCEQEAKKPGISEDLSNIIQYIMIIDEVNKLDANKPEDVERLLEILKVYGVRGKPKEFAGQTTMVGDAPKANVEGKKASFQIVREHLPTAFLRSKPVWEALLQDMPMHALIRNLNKMTSLQMFDDEKNVQLVVNSLTNPHKLKTARVHPMKILLAMVQYNKGHGHLGNLSWHPNPEIAGALDKAFYLSFKQPELKEGFRTGKKYMLCLDVSGSMSFRGCVGTDTLTPAMASAAMAWVTWNIEEDENTVGNESIRLVAFGRKLEDMKERGFNKDMRIDEVVRKFSTISFGATNCALPMIEALQQKHEVDVFIVYTDSETNCNMISPAQALRDYNKQMKRNAKLVVCGLMSNGFTIADPHDPGMMDVVGFDSNVPELISEFAMGNLSGKCSEKCRECK